jgi:hypothetical protein
MMRKRKEIKTEQILDSMTLSKANTADMLAAQSRVLNKIHSSDIYLSRLSMENTNQANTKATSFLSSKYLRYYAIAFFCLVITSVVAAYLITSGTINLSHSNINVASSEAAKNFEKNYRQIAQDKLQQIAPGISQDEISKVINDPTSQSAKDILNRIQEVNRDKMTYQKKSFTFLPAYEALSAEEKSKQYFGDFETSNYKDSLNIETWSSVDSYKETATQNNKLIFVALYSPNASVIYKGGEFAIKESLNQNKSDDKTFNDFQMSEIRFLYSLLDNVSVKITGTTQINNVTYEIVSTSYAEYYVDPVNVSIYQMFSINNGQKIAKTVYLDHTISKLDESIFKTDEIKVPYKIIDPETKRDTFSDMVKKYGAPAIKGINVFLLADNVNDSVSMWEKLYSSHAFNPLNTDSNKTGISDELVSYNARKEFGSPMVEVNIYAVQPELSSNDITILETKDIKLNLDGSMINAKYYKTKNREYMQNPSEVVFSTNEYVLFQTKTSNWVLVHVSRLFNGKNEQYLDISTAKFYTPTEAEAKAMDDFIAHQ